MKIIKKKRSGDTLCRPTIYFYIVPDRVVDDPNNRFNFYKAITRVPRHYTNARDRENGGVFTLHAPTECGFGHQACLLKSCPHLILTRPRPKAGCMELQGLMGGPGPNGKVRTVIRTS